MSACTRHTLLPEGSSTPESLQLYMNTDLSLPLAPQMFHT